MLSYLSTNSLLTLPVDVVAFQTSPFQHALPTSLRVPFHLVHHPLLLDILTAALDRHDHAVQEACFSPSESGLFAPVVLLEEEVVEFARVAGTPSRRARSASTSSSDSSSTASSSIIAEADSLLSVDSATSSVSTALSSAIAVEDKKDDFPSLSPCALPAALDLPSSSLFLGRRATTLIDPVVSPSPSRRPCSRIWRYTAACVALVVASGVISTCTNFEVEPLEVARVVDPYLPF
ncbi:hypothetical protein JCM8547_001229 [Rhodosporidiobolus lusitaniae]